MDAQQVSSRRADLLVEAVKLLPPAQLNLSKFAKDVHK